jgi:hypothetical protein
MIVLAAEGECTEEQYFKPLRRAHIDIEILVTDHGYSAPQYVEERMNSFITTNQGLIGGEFWLVMDVDHWHQLADVCQRAHEKGYQTAVSNPCFELWLWLHLADVDTSLDSCTKLEAALKTYPGGYNKSNLQVDRFHPNIAVAMKRAENLLGNGSYPIPEFPGTHVPRLMERILSGATG